MSGKGKGFTRQLRPIVLLTALCVPVIISVIIYVPSLSAVRPLMNPVPVEPPSAKWKASTLAPRCVRVARGGQSKEGLGAVIKRNQMALFLASWYDVPLQFPVKESLHGYNLHEVFGLCPGETAHPEKSNKTGENDPCTLYMARMIIPICPRSDCECLFGTLAPYVEPHLAQGCREISVLNDNYKTLSYSGCIKNVLHRYMVGDAHKPAWEYDAVHYRQGDLAHKSGGGKVMRSTELYYIIKAMCLLSDRDIIVLTEGAPTIPECGNRVVLAGDTTIQEAFWIMKHAKVISVGVSSFGIAMVELAKPQHMVIRDLDVRKYDWVDCENWSIITKDGGTFHFTSKAMMIEYLFSFRRLKDIASRTEEEIEKDVFTESVPKRKWKRGMMSPVKLK